MHHESTKTEDTKDARKTRKTKSEREPFKARVVRWLSLRDMNMNSMRARELACTTSSSNLGALGTGSRFSATRAQRRHSQDVERPDTIAYAAGSLRKAGATPDRTVRASVRGRGRQQRSQADAVLPAHAPGEARLNSRRVGLRPLRHTVGETACRLSTTAAARVAWPRFARVKADRVAAFPRAAARRAKSGSFSATDRLDVRRANAAAYRRARCTSSARRGSRSRPPCRGVTRAPRAHGRERAASHAKIRADANGSRASAARSPAPCRRRRSLSLVRPI